MTNDQKLDCPLQDLTQCKLEASLELSGGRGIVQQNCHTCGAGKAVSLPLEEALALHDELHRHSPPAGGGKHEIRSTKSETQAE